MSRDEIVCRHFAELATDYLEGAVPEDHLELVEEHLAMCDWCREYLHQIETTSAVVSEVAAPGPPEETLDALLGAFRAHTRGDAPR
jgi:predicted anti-sigma-YlaC factor YlaD